MQRIPSGKVWMIAEMDFHMITRRADLLFLISWILQTLRCVRRYGGSNESFCFDSI